ncbi:MAG: YoaK family protein [Terricaulis sp.]
MLRYRRRYWVFAAALSTLAGFADANAFVHLGGYFVSFMSGNSTRLGVGLASNLDAARLAGGLIAIFVLGVIIGALVNRRGDHAGGARVLACVSGLLILAALLASTSAPSIAIALLATAMGAMNGVFVREGEVSIGVTYMTGTLVRMGQRLASALTGGKRWEWVPYALLWSGLVLGATLGALSYGSIGLQSLWFAAAFAALLTIVLSRMSSA